MRRKNTIAERHERYNILKRKYQKYDFSTIKAVVSQNDIDHIIKQNDGKLMIGTKEQCNNWMLQKFTRNPIAPIVMRDIDVFNPENANEIFLGQITR